MHFVVVCLFDCRLADVNVLVREIDYARVNQLTKDMIANKGATAACSEQVVSTRMRIISPMC